MPFNRDQSDFLREVRKLFDLPGGEQVLIPSASAAGDYEIVVFVAPSQCSSGVLSRASLYPSAAIVGAATNFQTLQFKQYSSAGVAVGTFGTTYVTTANLSALVEKNLFNGALSVNPGDIITLVNAHTGTGAALPSLSVAVEFSPYVVPTF